MEEFVSRMAAQRRVLELVNQRQWPKEELFGLSRKAIDRWMAVNGVRSESRVAGLICAAAEKLFFLANKSQEQISADYIGISNEFRVIAQEIEKEMSSNERHVGTGSVL
jgi:hypothetical protein